MPQHRFSQLVTALGSALNAPDLAPGGDDTLELMVDGDLRLILGLDADTECIRLRADILDCGGRPTPALARMLCSANLYWRGTAGATLGLDREDGAVCLLYASPIQVHDDKSFLETVETFLNLAEHWRNEIRGFMDGGETPRDEPEIPFNALRI
ncbi:type III secretion system chaperone [Desulfocurvus sp. DL9XJH121]